MRCYGLYCLKARRRPAVTQPGITAASFYKCKVNIILYDITNLYFFVPKNKNTFLVIINKKKRVLVRSYQLLRYPFFPGARSDIIRSDKMIIIVTIGHVKGAVLVKEHSNQAQSAAIYGLGFIGAVVYYISVAPTFWMGLLGVLKAMVWPAFLVYDLMKFLGM